MDRPGHDNEVFDAILQAAPRACLLTGPAGSGKTCLALALAEHYRNDNASAGGYLLAPNATTAADLRNRLLRRSEKGMLLAPPVLTFRSLAERILTALSPSDQPPRFIDPLRRHLMLQQIVADSARSNTFDAFAPIADAPGLVSSLERSISELKRAAADPADLDAAFGEARGKTRDLLAVYRTYQQKLQAANLFDPEGQMWQVRDALRHAETFDAAAAGLPALRALIVESFTDFTPTQLEILASLARHVEALVITLPWADDDRTRMWQWTDRTRQAIEKVFDPSPVHIRLTPPQDHGQAMDLARYVFTYQSAETPLPSCVNLIEAPSIEGEVTAVAKRVKRLLVDGAQAGSIAVLARSQETYRDTVQRVFAAHDIPLAPPAEPLGTTPPVALLLQAAALPENNFAARDLLAIIKHSYIQPQAFAGAQHTSLAIAEMIIREGNVYAGRNSYAHAAARLSKRPARHEDDDARPLGSLNATPAGVLAAAAMLDALFETLAPQPEETLRDRLLRLIDALQLRKAILQNDQPDRLARDLRAIERLAELLGAIDDWPPRLPALRAALAQVALAPPRDDSVVDVLSVLDARGLRWPHVFLLGCSEGQFPQSFGESALLSEADRRRWIRRNVALDRRSDLTAREMLLFYLALSRAEGSLTCSYLAADAAGQAAGPGPFLQTAVEPFGGLENLRRGKQFSRLPVGTFVPAPQDIGTGREAVMAALAGAFSTTQPPSPAALAWTQQHAPHLLRHAAMGLWAATRRWTGEGCDAFDGRLSDPALIDQLARDFGPDAQFSASRFNTFGECRWHFFGRYVCHLDPLAEPQRQLEPVTRGVFMHNLLYRVYTRLAAEHGRPLRLWALDWPLIAAALDQAFEAERSRIDAADPPYPVLWDIQQQQLRHDAEGYLRSEHDDPFELRAECLHFELGFAAGRPGDLLDPASQDAPVTLATSAGPIQLVGKIDRVDRICLDGQPGLLVVDYKTGRLPAAKDAMEGTNLQMPLYIEAVGHLLDTDEPCVGGVYHAIAAEPEHSYFAQIERKGKVLHENPAFATQQAEAMAHVGRYVEAMRRGEFDLLPHPEKARYDDYREIDHYSPVRAEIKQLPALEAET